MKKNNDDQDSDEEVSMKIIIKLIIVNQTYYDGYTEFINTILIDILYNQGKDIQEEQGSWFSSIRSKIEASNQQIASKIERSNKRLVFIYYLFILKIYYYNFYCYKQFIQ